MSFSGAITSLTEEQLRQIIKMRRAVPLATFLAANGKARQACALRHRGWMETNIVYVNAMLIACKLTGIRDALDMATLMSSVESFGIGMMAKEDLTLEEHILLISCVAEVATPEIIPTKQDWIPEPLPKLEAAARQNYEALKQRDQPKGRRQHEPDPDPDGDLVEAGIDPGKALAAMLGGKKKEAVPTAPKVSSGDAIVKMMAALQKKVGETVAVPEAVRVEKGSGGSWQLVGVDTGTIFGDTFPKPVDAIMYATRNKLKLGKAE